MLQWRFLNSATLGVHVLDLDNFQFSSKLGNFNPVVCGNSKANYLGFLAGFIYNNHVWSSMLNYIVCLNVKVPENFKRLIFWKKYVFVTFLGNSKAFLSTNIRMYSLSHSVMLSYVFFLKKFRTLRNNVSDYFIVGFTHSAYGAISSTIYLRFDDVGSNAVVLSTSN